MLHTAIDFYPRGETKRYVVAYKADKSVISAVYTKGQTLTKDWLLIADTWPEIVTQAEALSLTGLPENPPT